MLMEQRFYVYELFDPRDGATFYVGKGQRDRMHKHEREAAKGVCSRKCHRIRDIIQSGFGLGKRVVARFDDEVEAYQHEAELIEHYGMQNLTNVVRGWFGVVFSRAAARVLTPIEIVEKFPEHFVYWLKITNGGAYKTTVSGGVPFWNAVTKTWFKITTTTWEKASKDSSNAERLQSALAPYNITLKFM